MHNNNSIRHIETGTNLYELAYYLLDDSRHGYLVLDFELNILVWNKQLSRWSGHGRADAIGLPLLEVFPHLQQSKLFDSIKQCLAQGAIGQAKFHDKPPILPLQDNGAELTHEVHISSLPDLHGGHYCILEIVDATRLHNLHNSFVAQSKEFDSLIRSSIANDAQLYALFNNPLFAVMLLSQNGEVTRLNRRALQLFALDDTSRDKLMLGELLFKSEKQAIDNDPIALLNSQHQNLLARREVSDEQSHAVSNPAYSADSVQYDWIPVRLNCTGITLNKSFGYIVLLEDFQQQTAELKRLSRARQDIELALGLVSDAIIKTDARCIIRSFNSKAEQLTACSAKNAIGKSLHDIISLHDAQSNSPFYISERWINSNHQNHCIRNLKVSLTRRDHLKVDVDLSVTTVNYGSQENDNAFGHELILVLHDNSAQLEYDRKLAWHNTHDSLTGLVNRTEFEKRLKDLIRDVQNHQQHHAVLHLGLDQLKIINNTCGHDAGDALLREVTAYIKSKLGPEDTVSRLGGDEFGILLYNRKTPEAHKFAEALNHGLYHYRFIWQGQEFPASTSIGVVAINITSTDVKNALSNAQSACLLAKETGRNRVQLYATGHNSLIKQQQRMHWHHRIQRALDKDKLVLYVQQIVPSAHHKQLRPRLEMLVRIQDEGKLVLPDAFIPAAEHYQMMPKIDQWVVKNCLGFYASLPEAIRLPININLSGQSIGDEAFLQYLVDQIKRYKIDPSLICFELTETAAIFDLAAARDFMNELAEMGCEFALDDFGSGLSSLSYLKNLPVNYLKIDGAFVKNIIGNHVDDEILQSINRIGHVMNIKTVAEYVETPAIQDRLLEIGIDYLQGFLIHKPTLLQDFFTPRPAKQHKQQES